MRIVAGLVVACLMIGNVWADDCTDYADDSVFGCNQKSDFLMSGKERQYVQQKKDIEEIKESQRNIESQLTQQQIRRMNEDFERSKTNYGKNHPTWPY